YKKTVKMVLLIGAASFLGPPVLKKLLENNYDVNCLVRTDSDRSRLLDAARSAGKDFINFKAFSYSYN
ncbi:unnamed protein product, partial [marine sediment metagenome]